MATKLLERRLGIITEDPETLHRFVSPEICLIGAVVKHAVHEWLLYFNSKDARLRRLGEKARRWIFDRGEGPTTFDTYCNLIGVEPDMVREQMVRRRTFYSRKSNGDSRSSSVRS